MLKRNSFIEIISSWRILLYLEIPWIPERQQTELIRMLYSVENISLPLQTSWISLLSYRSGNGSIHSTHRTWRFLYFYKCMKCIWTSQVLCLNDSSPFVIWSNYKKCSRWPVERCTRNEFVVRMNNLQSCSVARSNYTYF